MVTRTHPSPFGEPIRTAKNRPVVANFHQQAGGGHPIDAGDSQHQLQGRLLGFEPLQHVSFEVGQLGFQDIDVAADQAGDEQMFLAEFALQGGEQLFLRCPQASGMGECLFRRAPAQQAVDQRPCRNAVEIGDHPVQADTGVG